MHTPWDDGAADTIPVNVSAATQPVLINGPVVLLGYWFKNTGGATSQIGFFDGAGKQVFGTSITAGGQQNTPLPDRGLIFETDIELSVSGGGPVTGAIWVRQKYMVERRAREWHTRSDHEPPQSRPAHSPAPR